MNTGEGRHDDTQEEVERACMHVIDWRARILFSMREREMVESWDSLVVGGGIMRVAFLCI